MSSDDSMIFVGLVNETPGIFLNVYVCGISTRSKIFLVVVSLSIIGNRYMSYSLSLSSPIVVTSLYGTMRDEKKFL